jgi:hypothetical protein
MKIIELMKNLIQKIIGLPKKLIAFFERNLSKFSEHGRIAVIITENFKKAVESPVADGIVLMIPGNKDNILLEKARKLAPVIAFKVAVAHKILSSNPTVEDILTAIGNKLKDEDRFVKGSFWIRFNAELILALADGKISLSESLILGQMLYNEIFKNK